MRYRPEIDGLRAVAVLPVILFHAGFPLFKGGFVGVDVFFVISGYLITSILLAEMDAGRFSLLKFYERRARRILPALFFLMAICVPFAWVWLWPRDMQAFSQSLSAVSVFASNILFWRQSGYFDTAGELKPLLHTWSLAVEEQFYILFPLLLLLIWGLGKRRILAVLVVLSVVSLGIAHVWAETKPNAAFYLLTTRGWEILVGAFAAFYFNKRPRSSPAGPLEEVLGFCGLALIASAVFLFDKTTPFPSLFTLVPTVGALLIILFAHDGTITNHLLRVRVLVGIGLISYSAYLWHQPLLAFARHRSVVEPSIQLLSVLCVLTIPIAYLSWRFVEQPFRDRNRFDRNTVFASSGVLAVAFLAFGMWGHASKGFPARVDDEIKGILKYADDRNPDTLKCSSSAAHGYLAPDEACTLGAENNVIGVLMGDSHSNALAYALGEDLKESGVGVHHMWYSNCPPVTGLYRVDKTANNECDRYNTEAFERLENDPALKYVILAARFTLYYEGNRFSNGEGGVETGDPFFVDGVAFKGATRTEAQRKATVSKAYVAGIKALLNRNKKVVLVYPIPEMGWDVPSYAAKQMLLGDGGEVSTSYARYRERNRAVFEIFDSLGEQDGLVRIYPHKVFCDSFVTDRCAATVDGKSLYYDDDHLSNYGASYITGNIVSRLR